MQIETIYVDNCSTDGSVDYIKQQWPQVKIVKNVEPLGFGENNNKGVMASTGDYIGIVNPDIAIPEGNLGEIIKMVKTILGGAIL